MIWFILETCGQLMLDGPSVEPERYWLDFMKNFLRFTMICTGKLGC
jgi:hypothetical protein